MALLNIILRLIAILVLPGGIIFALFPGRVKPLFRHYLETLRQGRITCLSTLQAVRKAMNRKGPQNL